MGRTVSITLPDTLWEQSEKLVEAGYFSDLDDVIKAGVRSVLLDWSAIDSAMEPPDSTNGEQFAYYLHRLRRRIREAGGLFPGKTKDQVIEIMRHTREEIYQEDYADHFGRQ